MPPFRLAILGGRALVVHLIDPFPPGAGRIWRHAQSPLLRMNSMAEDVTMFTDDTVLIDGPIRPGPSLWEWASQEHAVASELRSELTTMDSTSFPTRRLASAYLDWVYRDIERDLPAGVEVVEHRTRATSIEGGRVRLGNGEVLDADVLLLTVGHPDAEPDPAAAVIRDFAGRHGLSYYPASYPAGRRLLRRRTR